MPTKLVIPETVKNKTALQKPNVSTQEIGQYGKGNIDLKNRQIAYNDDGSISTLRSMSFNDGKNEILIPTVVNGKVVSDKDAINHYYNTGEYLGKFNTVKEADDYANELHKQQEDFYTPRVNAYKTLLNASNNGNVMTYNQAADQRINEIANYTNSLQGPQPQKQTNTPVYDDEFINSSHFRRGHGQTKTFNRTSGIYNDRENVIEIFKTPENMEDNLRRFDDGYNFGDVAKTAGEYVGEGLLDVGNTVAEAPFRVTKGLLSVPENLANLGAGFAAGVSDIAGDLTGNPYLNQYATNIRKNVVNENNFFKPANEALDKLGDYYGKNSFAGKTLKSAEEATGQTIGQLAVTQALGAAGGKTEIPIKFGNNHVLNVPVTALATGLGSGVKESYTIADQQLNGIENATWREKAQMALRTLRSGAVEGVTEGMFGLLGMGGSDITDKWANEAVKKASNAFEKQLVKIMYAGGGEAAEEFISYAANWLLDNGLINAIGNVDYSKDWNWDEVMEEMASAYISAGFSQGASNLQNVRQTTKRAMNTAEDVAKARGLPLSQSEKATIKNNAADIALTEEQQELKPNLASVYSSYAPNVYENKTAPSSEQLRQGMSKYIQSTQENNDEGAKTRFSLGGEESTIRQSANQLTKYKVPEQFINLSEYIMRQRPGLTIRVDENIPENGRYNEKTREIVINPSKLDRALEFTLVHELGHDFKTGDQATYEALQKYVLDFARTKQGFEEAKKSLNAEYLKKLNEKDFVLNDEATNDILGQILGNQDYLNNMYQTDRNLFQKIYDWFRNVLFDGNKTGLSYNERKYLNEIQRRFENAFNQEYKGKGNVINYSMQETATENPDIRYSLSETPYEINDGFYSQVEKVISTKMSNKADAQTIKNLLNKNGAKQDELDWLDMDSFLASKDSFTKQEVLDYIKANQIEIVEETLDSWNQERAEEELEMIKEEQDSLIEKAIEVFSNYKNDFYNKDQKREIQEWFEFINEARDSHYESEIIDEITPDMYIKHDGETEEDIQANVDSDRDKMISLYEEWRDYQEQSYSIPDYDSMYPTEGEARFKKWSSHFGGGTNYREVLFTLPYFEGNPFYKREHWGGTANVFAHTRLQDYKDSDGKNVLFVEEVQSDLHQKGRKEGYQNNISGISHQLKEKVENVKKERIKIREEIDNITEKYNREYYKKLEESETERKKQEKPLQDRLEEIRDEIGEEGIQYYAFDADYFALAKRLVDEGMGYKNLGKDDKVLKYETIQELLDINFKLYEIENKALGIEGKYYTSADSYVNKKLKNDEKYHELEKKDDILATEEYNLAQSRRDIESQIDSKFPFKKSWHEFVIRKIINEAVKNGYDKVALATGDQNNDHYGLAEYIDSLEYIKRNNGDFYISVIDKDGVERTIGEYPASKLEDVVGKEIAQKMTSGEFDKDVYGRTEGKLENIDLKIGGEGMRAFYDKILPEYIAKYIKKWGGKLEDVVINGNHQQGFTITPEMREAVENEGQVLFSKSDKKWDSFLKNDMNLMPNANKSFAERINNQVKNDVNVLNLGKNKVDIMKNKSYNGVERNNENQYVTAAPYREENVNDKNYESKKAKVEGTFLNKANEISRQLGVKIKNISDNMGGFVSQQGKNKGNFVNEVSYTFELENATKEQADMLASIMADTGFETQEAVISSNYTDEGEGNAIEVIFKVNSLKGIPGILKRLGIQEYTIDRANKEIKLFQSDFSSITDQNLADLSMELGGNLYGTETTNVESRYIDAETRRDIYQKWLETTEESEENRELRNSISEALKAVNKELESQENSEQGSFLNDNKIGEEGSKAFNLQEEKAKGEELVNDPEKFFSDKVKTRSWTETVKKNKYISDNVTLDELYYEPQSNKSLIDRAAKAIEQNGYEATLNELDAVMNSGKNITDKDLAKGELLMTQAVKEGRLDDAVRLHSDLTIMLTELGRAVQAASIISKLTPEGQLMHLERVIKRMNAKNLEQDKDTPTVKLSDEDKKAILGAKDAADLEQIMDDTLQHIADQLPVTLWDKLDAWRYLAMLGNPRTHVRNTIANVAMKGLTGAKNVTARAIETALQKNLKERTRTFEKPSQAVLDFVNQDAENINDILKGNKYGTTDELLKRRKIFKNELLEKARKFNDKALEAEDTFFTVRQYKKSMAEYLAANGIKTAQQIKDNPKLIEKARTHSIQEAEEATFHQANKFSQLMNELEQSGVAGKIVVGGAIPFKKTPANIVTTGFKYSPLGLGETVLAETARLKKGKITANEYIDRISQGLTGTGLTLLGVFLAKIGLISGSSKDKDEKYKESIGARQAYSLNVGDRHYDLSWASPSAMPLMVGAELYEILQKKDADLDVNDAIDALTKTLDPLSEMSMIQSINSTIKTYNTEGEAGAILGAAKNAGKSYASQFIPTLFSQFNKIVDKTARSTKASRTAPIKDVDSFLRQSANKTPFASFLLEPSTDVWGRNNERGNILERSFEALINPGTVKKDKSTDVDKEILKLYEINNNDDIIPKTPNDYFQLNKVKYELSAKEYTEFKKKYGQITYTQLQKLINSSEYKSKSTEAKEQAIKKVYENALKQVKKEYVKNQ